MMTVETDSTMRHPDAAAISKSLEGVLRSPQFKDALQLQSLLKYIVENSIGGHDDALKERIIGMNVFGRKPDYETADDPIVRSRVGQLRRRLEQYYASAEAAESSVQILIPNGSYRPTFVLGQGTRGANKVIPPLDPPPPMAAAAAAKPPREHQVAHMGNCRCGGLFSLLGCMDIDSKVGKDRIGPVLGAPLRSRQKRDHLHRPGVGLCSICELSRKIPGYQFA